MIEAYYYKIVFIYLFIYLSSDIQEMILLENNAFKK